MEEVAELSELMEEALGLLLRADILRELLALVGVVHGKPMRVTLWAGANRPYRDVHWKYLRGGTTRDRWVGPFPLQAIEGGAKPRAGVLGPSPGPRHGAVVLAERFVQLHAAPASLCEVRLPEEAHHAGLVTAHLDAGRTNPSFSFNDLPPPPS